MSFYRHFPNGTRPISTALTESRLDPGVGTRQSLDSGVVEVCMIASD